MKNIAKKAAIVLTVLALSLSAFSLVACNKSKYDYTVKVVGPDGAPYTSAFVQPCEVGSDGELSTCYDGVKTDSKGVAHFTLGKEIPNKKANQIEVHLLGLPVYLTYEKPRMHKGETVTIQLTEKLSTPSKGTGKGGYTTDILGNPLFDMDIYDPYIVGVGAYAFKFTSADQKIYFEFKADYEAVYKVYSVGKIDASVTQLTGTKSSGIRNTGDEEFRNDNVSATDKNFSYEFEVSPELLEQDNGACYFEIALENAADVNKDAIICFEEVDEYVDDTVQDEPVYPSETLEDFDEYEYSRYTYVDVSLYDADTGDFTYEMGDDGFYHVGDKTGPVLVASLGKDIELNDKHTGDVLNAPRGYEVGFTLQYKEGGGLTYEGKNYYPLVEAYVKASNSDGRYGVTEELKTFLTAYIGTVVAKSHVEEVLGTYLPEGKEWLWACGYYLEIPLGSGTEDDPITLTEGLITVNVPAGGEVYYAAFTMMPTIYTFMSDNTDISFKAYESGSPEIAIDAESDEGGFYCDVTTERMSYYYFVFSTKSGSAATYSVNVLVSGGEEPAEPDGSSDNPFIIYGLGWQYGETTETNFEGKAEPVYYTYTVTAEDEALYFYLGENTVLSVQYMVGEGSVDKSYEEFEGKLIGVAADTVITIMVATEEGIGDFEFGIFGGPFGSKKNPYTMQDEDDYEISVPAGEKVVYSFYSFSSVDYKLTAASGSVKAVWYAEGGTETTVSSSGDSFTLTISATAGTMYYVEFSSISGEAAEYTVTLEILYPEGSMENPKKIETAGTVTDTTTPGSLGGSDPVYFTYTVTADCTVYFTAGDNTTLLVIYTDENGEEQMKWLNEWEDDLTAGLVLKAGTVLKIEAGTADYSVGTVSFTITEA